jgi:hypothetical protein
MKMGVGGWSEGVGELLSSSRFEEEREKSLKKKRKKKRNRGQKRDENDAGSKLGALCRRVVLRPRVKLFFSIDLHVLFINYNWEHLFAYISRSTYMLQKVT